MTEGKPATSKPAKELLALDPQEEAKFRKRVQAVKKKPKKVGTRLDPGVVYIAHLPKGLVEAQLKSYLQQFGPITRLRLARSKKTGGSKGYAFVEFECDEVAKIVAETMNNYLMRERLIKCHLMPPEKVHAKLFAGASKGFKVPTFPAVSRYNKSHTPEGMAKMTDNLLRKEAKLRKRLAARGVDYDFPGFASQIPQKKKPTDDADTSTLSDDVTPLCTPSVLERRKSVVRNDDDTDDEIVVKLPQGLDDEDRPSGEEDGDEEAGDEEHSESEEPSKGDEAE